MTEEESDDDEESHDEDESEEDVGEGFEGLTLVDTRNGFNELSRYLILWTVRHCWAKGSRFSFNCYMHFVMYVMHQPGGEPHIFLSEERVAQGGWRASCIA